MSMKPITIIVFAITLLIACDSGRQSSQENTAAAGATTEVALAPATSGKYGIRSGIIHFEIETLGTKTRKIVYFDDFGSKERTENYNADGSLRDVNLSDGKTRYTIMPDKETAYIADRNGSIGWEMQFVSWSTIQRQRDYEKNYKKAENRTIAGKDCEAFVYGGNNTFAGWNGLTLYHEQTPVFVMTATRLEENVTHDKGRFEVPVGFKVEEFKF